MSTNKTMITKIMLNNVPNSFGCYLWKNSNNDVIYVGKSKNLKSRMIQYLNDNVSSKTKVLMKHATSFDFQITKNEKDALLLELNLISKYNPKYNVRLKNDKKYPYIVLKLNNNKINLSLSSKYKKDNHLYFGPFPEGFSVSKIIKILKIIFPISECKNPKGKSACINYQLGLCLGYCVKQVSKEQVEIVYQDVKKFLKGNTKNTLHLLNLKMDNYSKLKRYEEALTLKKYIIVVKEYDSKQGIYFKDSLNRDVISYVENNDVISLSITFVRNGLVVNVFNDIFRTYDLSMENTIETYLIQFYKDHLIPHEIITNLDSELKNIIETKWIIDVKKGLRKDILDMTKNHAIEKLKQEGSIFNLSEEYLQKGMDEFKKIINQDNIDNIEMVDISNVSGKYQVGAVIGFKDGKANRSKYRKYKLPDGQNDYKNIYEVTYRHFNQKIKNNLDMPNVYLIDGKYQIFNAQKALDELGIKNISIVGIVKNQKHKTSAIIYNSKITKIEDKHLLQFLSSIQEEVHRFVINYHRKLKFII